jgi:hypothetical protein
MNILLFLFVAFLLLAEGYALARIVIQECHGMLLIGLALPLGAISNVLLFCLYTIVGIPLAALWLLIGHCTILATAVMIARKRQPLPSPSASLSQCSTMPRVYRCCCGVLLAVVFAFSAVHALWLHSFAIDSFTNWTMRSRISFEDSAMAFDRTETRGVAKPQYPFLVHSLQIMANQGGAWRDRAANAITFLLSWSSLFATFLMLKRLRGSDAALTGITLIAGIPLLSVHLAQGYGDIHLTTYLLLSLLSIALYEETGERRWLTLCALTVLAALWTKSEGIFFGFLPWAVLSWMMAKRKGALRSWGSNTAAVLLCFLPFLILLYSKGLGFTPHDSDSSFAWHPEAIRIFFSSLLRFGSLGVTWYLAPAAVLLLALNHTDPPVHRSSFPLLLWPAAIVAMNAVIYLCTPNVAFLINGQSFARQMMPASALLLAALILMIDWRGTETAAS